MCLILFLSIFILRVELMAISSAAPCGRTRRHFNLILLFLLNVLDFALDKGLRWNDFLRSEGHLVWLKKTEREREINSRSLKALRRVYFERNFFIYKNDWFDGECYSSFNHEKTLESSVNVKNIQNFFTYKNSLKIIYFCHNRKITRKYFLNCFT